MHLVTTSRSARTLTHAHRARRVPLYYEGKLLFVLWLWHPSTGGAGLIYSHLLLPLLKQNEATIDQTSAEFQALFFDYVTNGVRW